MHPLEIDLSPGTAPAADPAAEVIETKGEVKGEIKTPQGTVTLLIGFAALIVILWGYMYAIMILGR